MTPGAGPDGSAGLLVGTGLWVRRAGRDLLAGVDVAVAPGEALAVTGPSGSGKSTLLAVLAGLEPPDAGTVTLAGADLAGLEPAELRRRVGLVLQGYALLALLTAAENVDLALRAAGSGMATERADRALAALATVGLADRADHLLEELSGGEQQRVAVARALVGRPAVLVADEPTAELDAQTRERVLDLLFDVTRTGVALVLATHDPDVACRCDRQLLVRDGELLPVYVEPLTEAELWGPPTPR